MSDAPIFAGIPNLHTVSGGVVTTNIPVGSLPTGYDAVMQCDSVLLQSVLVTNLAQAGVSTLGARVAYSPELFPKSVQQAVAPLAPTADASSGTVSDIELRLVSPTLTVLSAGYEPPLGSVIITTGTSATARTIPGFLKGPPLQISWTIELNYVRGIRISHSLPISIARAPIPASALRTESRTLLAHGSAVTSMPASIATRPELLQLWLEMDVSQTTVSITTDDAMLQALLGSTIGQNMVKSALATLTSQSSLRASPLFAIPGVMTQAQVQALGLNGMRVSHAVHHLPNGHQVLTLAVNFGADSRGSVSDLQPFLNGRHFACFASLSTLTPIFRERWRLNPGARDYVGDVQVTMPKSEGSDDTGQGKVRLHVNLSDSLNAVTLAPFESEQGDVLQLGCDETVQMLRAWYANGSEVSDLGDLGAPATMPFIANNAPFTPAKTAEEENSPIRGFLRYVLEPLAYPMVERFDLATVDGFASAALGAVVTRWSLPIMRHVDVGGVVVTGGATSATA